MNDIAGFVTSTVEQLDTTLKDVRIPRKNLGIAIARELIQTGRTAKPVTGFRGRSGRSFRARLALVQGEDGKWRVEFDEPWAREGAKPPEEVAEPQAAAAAPAEAA